MPVPDRERARHMVLRVERELRRKGVAEAGLVQAAVEWAMVPRNEALSDDHDPRYLHPGRSVLVALGDGGLRDPALLAATALLESVDPALRAPDPRGAGGSVAALLDGPWSSAASLPGPWDEALTERLVTSGDGLQTVVLAEWLDQLRHLRHWASPREVDQAHEVTGRVYLPLARRGHEALSRRLAWWMRRVART